MAKRRVRRRVYPIRSGCAAGCREFDRVTPADPKPVRQALAEDERARAIAPIVRIPPVTYFAFVDRTTVLRPAIETPPPLPEAGNLSEPDISQVRARERAERYDEFQQRRARLARGGR